MGTTMMTECFDIYNGPSRDLLFDACKYAYDKGIKIPIDFKVALGTTRPKEEPTAAYVPMQIGDFSIASIEHEDGSGTSFNIVGFCKANLPINNDGYKSYMFEIYYKATRREGYIRFRIED